MAGHAGVTFHPAGCKFTGHSQSHTSRRLPTTGLLTDQGYCRAARRAAARNFCLSPQRQVYPWYCTMPLRLFCFNTATSPKRSPLSVRLTSIYLKLILCPCLELPSSPVRLAAQLSTRSSVHAPTFHRVSRFRVGKRRDDAAAGVAAPPWHTPWSRLRLGHQLQSSETHYQSSRHGHQRPALAR